MIPEDFFAADLAEGETLSEIIFYIVREGFTYPPGPPSYYQFISFLDCE